MNDPRPLTLWQRWRTSVMLGSATMGALVVYMIATVNDGRTDPAPVTTVEKITLCEALRDPSNDNFSTGTWERLTDWPEWKIRRHVAEWCPEQLDRFL